MLPHRLGGLCSFRNYLVLGVAVKRYTWPVVLTLAFGLGISVSPARAAESHPGPYATVFGHSTACTLGRASVNEASEKGGARTSNFYGCSSSNPTRNLPPYYLGAKAFVVRNSSGVVCGESYLYWNTFATWTRDASTSREYYGTGCESPGYFFGWAWNYRDSDAGTVYRRTDRVSNAYYFPSWMI